MTRHANAKARLLPALRELRDAPALDLRVKHALIALDSSPTAASCEGWNPSRDSVQRPRKSSSTVGCLESQSSAETVGGGRLFDLSDGGML